MRDKDFAAGTRAYYRQEVPRLMEGLQKAGYIVLPTCVNFFLLETADDEELMTYLLQRGIVVRHTRNFPGLDGRYIRIAAGTAKNNDLLIKTMREKNQNQ